MGHGSLNVGFGTQRPAIHKTSVPVCANENFFPGSMKTSGMLGSHMQVLL